MGEGQQTGEEAGASSPPTSRRSPAQQAQQLVAIERGRKAYSDKMGAELLASLKPGEGYVTRRSSPVLFWLVDQLEGRGE